MCQGGVMDHEAHFVCNTSKGFQTATSAANGCLKRINVTVMHNRKLHPRGNHCQVAYRLRCLFLYLW